MPLQRPTQATKRCSITIANEHAKLTKELNHEVEAFLNKGGKVQQIGIGETGFIDLKAKKMNKPH
jgi:hypothetical protein